jgi:hypothetical protein
MKRNKSIGLSKNLANNKQSNSNQRNTYDLMRMGDFDDFDTMFDDFGMNMGGGFDNIFKNFRSISRRFDDMHGDIFSK